VHDSENKAQGYAWNWFALHAGQRLQLVNFWLVAVAFLAAAFVQAHANHLTAIAIGVSATGALASLAFLRLDIRTQQLIQAAETALQLFEKELVDAGANPVIQLVQASTAARKSRLDSYRVIIRGLQLSVAVLFVLGAIYSLT
jgi:hypothetical protein